MVKDFKIPIVYTKLKESFDADLDNINENLKQKMIKLTIEIQHLNLKLPEFKTLNQ